MLTRLRPLLLTVLLTGMVVLLLQTSTPAQSPSNLQADLNRLRQQVAQLQAQIAQLRGQGAYPATTVPSQLPRRAELPDPQMFDRLAVLAIEAKDRLTALETRVTRLEQRLP